MYVTHPDEFDDDYTLDNPSQYTVPSASLFARRSLRGSALDQRTSNTISHGKREQTDGGGTAPASTPAIENEKYGDYTQLYSVSVQLQVDRILANRDPVTGRILMDINDFPDRMTEEQRAHPRAQKQHIFHGRHPVKPWMTADGELLL